MHSLEATSPAVRPAAAPRARVRRAAAVRAGELSAIADFGLYRRLIFTSGRLVDVTDGIEPLRAKLERSGYRLAPLGRGPGQAVYSVVPAR